MLVRSLLSLAALTSFAVGVQTPLHTNRYQFKLINYSAARSGSEQVSPIHAAGATVRSPFVYRNTTWSKQLNDAQKDAVKAGAQFEWRKSADTSNAQMEVTPPSDTRAYFAFSTNWHIVSGFLSSATTPEEFVTAIVPVSLDNGSLWGLVECVYVDYQATGS